MVFAPAAEAVMGAVGAAKAGVGSAMNDVTQMLAGALSIAVVGSVMFAIYAARLGDAAASLPAEQAEVVRDSIGAAVQLAATLPQLVVPLVLRCAGLHRSGGGAPPWRGRAIGVALDRRSVSPALGSYCHNHGNQRTAQRQDQGGRGSRADRRSRRCARAVPRSEVGRLEPLPGCGLDGRVRLSRRGPGVARGLIAARMRQQRHNEG